MNLIESLPLLAASVVLLIFGRGRNGDMHIILAAIGYDSHFQYRSNKRRP
jgi:hypothetical protein